MESHCDYQYPWADGGPGQATHAPGTGSTGPLGNSGSGGQGSVVGDFGGAICQDNLCSNKCVGKHDAAQAQLSGAVAATNHGDHWYQAHMLNSTVAMFA